MLFLRQTLLKTMASAQTQNRQHLQDIHHQQLQQMQKMQFELQQRLLDKLNEQQKNMVAVCSVRLRDLFIAKFVPMVR